MVGKPKGSRPRASPPEHRVGLANLGTLDARVPTGAPADNPPGDLGHAAAWRGASVVMISHSMGMAGRTRNHHNQPTRARSEQRQRQVMLAARVNAEEEHRIRDAAKAQNVSVASLIRKAVLAAVEQPSLSESECRAAPAVG